MIEWIENTFETWYGKLILFLLIILVFFAISIIFYRKGMKRFYDIVLSGIALIVLSVPFLLIAVLVRVKLGSPIIFKQQRVSKDNRIFYIHKFRTMADLRDENGELLPDKDRMTNFGRILRSTSMDELPELWDIFCGKMSIIGPRPQLVKDLVFMDESIRERHRVRGGLTGLAQVRGRNNISWNERFAFDAEYIKNLSFFLDMKIFFLTIGKVFGRSDIATDGMETSEDYGDYLLRSGHISEEYYLEKIREAKEMAEGKGK